MADTETRLSSLKSGFTESFHPAIDGLLPVVAQFGKMPPYSGENLELFVSSSTKNAATGWLFLELVSKFWQQDNPLSSKKLDFLTAAWGKTDSPVLLVKIIATALFNLDVEVQMGYMHEARAREILTSVPAIVKRVVQLPAPDSISGSIELNDVLYQTHLDPRSW